jgi:hypothetical protein
MDQDFITRALGSKIVNLNLSTRDFMSTKNKEEIRFLFQTHVMPELTKDMFTNTLSANHLNSCISKLSNSLAYSRVYSGYGLKGIGSGEVIIYLLIDGATLGGQSSAGVDVSVGGQKYEMKGASISSDGRKAYDFRLGGTVDAVSMNNLVNSIYELCKTNNIPVTNTSGIGSRVIDQLRTNNKTSKKFGEIEKQFKPIVQNYFSDNNIIFLDDKRRGYIASVKKIKNDDISIYRITQGKIKPAVKI